MMDTTILPSDQHSLYTWRLLTPGGHTADGQADDQADGPSDGRFGGHSNRERAKEAMMAALGSAAAGTRGEFRQRERTDTGYTTGVVLGTWTARGRMVIHQ